MPDSKPSEIVASSPVTRLSADDVYLLNEGSHFRLYDKLGAHPMTDSTGVAGTYFAVFAPHARSVRVFGDFNGWDKGANPLAPRESSGVWEGFVPGVEKGAAYKYFIEGADPGYAVDKADPYGFLHQGPPSNASVVWDLGYEWGDARWMAQRQTQGRHDQPVSIYEVHLGSWMKGDGGSRFLYYDEIADPLVKHVLELGFTHVELLPVMEHPFYGSWGYQASGFFAATSRYGSPQQLMYLIDTLHQNGIGVILDWVPGHFPSDEHGLGYFDGTHLYEHADPRRGFHPEWKSCIFDYGRREVQSFLFSSAFFWADKFHADGFRVDAVTSMLYLNYGRNDGEWLPNQHGGYENLEAVEFLRRFNAELAQRYPDVRTYAEESTAWPMVSRPGYLGGLGFDYKWDMGWMNDTLAYFGQDPIYRKFHHNRITFRMMYAYAENYILPLSHDEVVHGKGALLSRMPGSYQEKFAGLRLLLGNQFMQPGKKLLFMGGELGQWSEWNHDAPLDWNLLDYPSHQGITRWVTDLNRLYRSEAALHVLDHDPAGFQWVDCLDTENSVLCFLRWAPQGASCLLVVSNYTPIQRERYRIGVPMAGFWREVLNSDAFNYGGGGSGNLGGTWAEEVADHNHPYSVELTLPPLSCLVFKPGEPPR